MIAPAGAAPDNDGVPDFDLVLAGMVFCDIVFTGFPQPPTPGTEVWTDGMGTAPGGIANLAVAAARLGLHTALASGFGDDVYADWMWSMLADGEGIDLRYSRRFPYTHTPVSVSLAYADDRALVTHGHPWPTSAGDLLATPPRTHAVIVDLGDEQMREQQWWRTAAADGALVFADAGWDPGEQWDRRVLDALSGCHAFTPNAVEAMAYTRTSTPEAALAALTDHVPLAVVTMGADGVLAIDQSTGEEARVAAVPIEAVDTTGAGDVFAAALVLGTVRGWPLEKRLMFASLCSALAVHEVGGSLAAPGWGDIADWWELTRRRASACSAEAAETAQRFSFLTACLAGTDTRRVRRAEATCTRASDV